MANNISTLWAGPQNTRVLACVLFTGRLLIGRTIHREDNSPGVESFDQFSQIAFNNAEKAGVTTLYHHMIIKTHLINVIFTLKTSLSLIAGYTLIF